MTIHKSQFLSPFNGIFKTIFPTFMLREKINRTRNRVFLYYTQKAMIYALLKQQNPHT